jgi:hypothetical protein
VGRAEVSAVAGEHRDPLLPGLVEIACDEMRDVGGAAAGHADVGGRCAGVLTDDHVGGGNGVALHAVRGGGVGQLSMGGDVVRREHSLP